MASSIIKYKGETLLWSNSNTGNNFSAQSISIDFSSYERIIVETLWNTGSQSTIVTEARKGVRTPINLAYNRNYYRAFTFTNNSITFEDCKAISTYNSGTTANANDNLIPARIYGVR